MEWLFWAVLSALFAGATAVLAKIGVAGVNSNLATAIRTGVILLFSWLIALATTKSGDLWSIGRRTWIFLILSGLGTGLSWLCYFRALKVGEVSKVAPIDKLSVVFDQWLSVGLFECSIKTRALVVSLIARIEEFFVVLGCHAKKSSASR